MREWKKIQEMLRRSKVSRRQRPGARGQALGLFLVAGLAHGAIFPDQIGDFKKGPPKTVSVQDVALYDEYGLQATEQAEYSSADKHFSATAWRMHDSTGAMALFEARRPSGATPSNVTKLAVQGSDGILFAYGNYLFQFTGVKPFVYGKYVFQFTDIMPAAADMDQFYARLPGLEQSPLPALMSYLPADSLIPNSERYIVGPVSLQRFEPEIAPSVAAFHLGAEAQLAKYQTPKGAMTLAIFNYPTPGMARAQYEEFQKIPRAVAKRAGDLVAVIVAPPDPDAAERVLAQVRYETNITWNQSIPQNPVPGVAKLILDIFMFTGILLLGALVAGIGFGGIRILTRKFGRGEDPNAMITLHLSNK
jgi:hypothetical protein